jgi:hypothetical protein
MNKQSNTSFVLRRAALMAALSAVFATPAAYAFDSGSTGADGALNPTVNIEIQLPPSGILNYTTVNIPAGVTVKFKKNTTNTPVHILASGDVTIAGTIDIRGEDAKDSGTYGDGVLADDGIAGASGPGGFSGGRGGRDDLTQRPEIIRGGAGLGPGGGRGGVEGADGCADGRYYKYIGTPGAHSTIAQTPFYTWQCTADLTKAAKAYGSSLIQPLIGGSGGGGGRGGLNYAGSGGGGGGGAILIASTGTLRVTGSIDATGGDGGGASGTNVGGNGAGGSGGAIRLVATTITGNGTLAANGGCIHNSNQRRQLCGTYGSGYHNDYGGALGRIRLEASSITYNGASGPAYVADVPGPVFIAGTPSLRIASIAGQSVPANPSGNADITLPASTTTPVEVVFQSANVPVGNTVLLKVIPAQGNPIEVLSPAISGTTASGTTSVSVTLPQGPSTLQATTTYTVVVAMGDALSRFAQNERVEKVQLIATLGGASRAKLITISGKQYEVSVDQLRLAGFQG